MHRGVRLPRRERLALAPRWLPTQVRTNGCRFPPLPADFVLVAALAKPERHPDQVNKRTNFTLDSLTILFDPGALR
jgi:hypothetical protein